MVASDDVCPVCLDMLADSDTLKLPGCEHVIHVSCALSCAQYDSRCPICRNVTVTPRPQDDIFTHFEEELTERLTSYRLYRARRGRVIRRRESLKKIKNRLREANREYTFADKQLDREWSKVVRQIWNTNETIKVLKKERQRCQRKRNRYDRQLRERLESLIGEEPVMYI